MDGWMETLVNGAGAEEVASVWHPLTGGIPNELKLKEQDFHGFGHGFSVAAHSSIGSSRYHTKRWNAKTIEWEKGDKKEKLRMN